MIYTVVTREKKLVIMVVSKRAFAIGKKWPNYEKIYPPSGKADESFPNVISRNFFQPPAV